MRLAAVDVRRGVDVRRASQGLVGEGRRIDTVRTCDTTNLFLMIPEMLTRCTLPVTPH